MTIMRTFAGEQTESVARLSSLLYLASLMLGLGYFTGRLAAVAFGFLIIGGIVIGARTDYIAPLEQLGTWIEQNKDLSFVLLVAVSVSVVAFAGAPPPEIRLESGGVTNIVAHGAGLLFGMVAEVVVRYRYDRD